MSCVFSENVVKLEIEQDEGSIELKCPLSGDPLPNSDGHIKLEMPLSDSLPHSEGQIKLEMSTSLYKIPQKKLLLRRVQTKDDGCQQIVYMEHVLVNTFSNQKQNCHYCEIILRRNPTGKPIQTQNICEACNIPLCTSQDCFQEFHKLIQKNPNIPPRSMMRTVRANRCRDRYIKL